MGKMSIILQWCSLVAASAFASALINHFRLPAAWLLGPMVMAVIIKVNGSTFRVSRLLYSSSLALVGCLIASSMGQQSLTRFMSQWPWFVGIVLVIVFSTTAIGVLLSHYKLLPGSSAIWGLSPGAAAVMVVISESYGEDSQLVAFMQYLRVALVAVMTAVVAKTVFGAHDHPAHAILWFPELGYDFFATIAIASVGALAGKLLRIPAGVMLVPMFVGMTLQAADIVHIDLPAWVMIPAYAVLGWHVGSSFTKAICVHAFKVLPQILGAIAILVVLSGALAWVLTKLLHVDPLTAFLATSPGGMDSVILIAASSRADLAFVMTFQVVRTLIVVAIAPQLSKWSARHFKPDTPSL